METRQIHRLKAVKTFEFVKDPRTGRQTRVPVEQFVPDDTDRISHGDDVYEVRPDGSFIVPVDLAAFLVKDPDWHEGPNPFAEDLQEAEKPRAAARKPKAAA